MVCLVLMVMVLLFELDYYYNWDVDKELDECSDYLWMFGRCFYYYICEK